MTEALFVSTLFVGAGILVAAATGLVYRYALRRGIIDVPNHRSSHSDPTPRGGGLAMVVICLVGIAILGVTGALTSNISAALVGGSSVIAWSGWRDDRRGLPVSVRLGLQFAAAVFAVSCIFGATYFGTGITTSVSQILFLLFAVLGTVWLTNLYNFMDGIDGIAGTQALVAGGAAAWLLLSFSDYEGLAAAYAIVAGSAAGFLCWNWRPARIFMGDVGSGFLGFVFATLALAAAQRLGTDLLLLLLMPLAPFIVDATGTLLYRFLRRERVQTAHRSHVYQRLVDAGLSHSHVSLLAGAMALGTSGLALVAVQHPSLLVVVTIGGLLGTIGFGWIALRLAVPRNAAENPRARNA